MSCFPKSEKLCSKKIIDKLFSSRTKFVIYPFRVNYIIIDDQNGGVDVLFVVPKRFLKRAIARNRVKRLLRETYRLQKEDFKSSINLFGRRLHIAISLIDKIIPTFQQTQTATEKILDKLQKDLTNEDIKEN
jgi:ribonuclease P protein component